MRAPPKSEPNRSPLSESALRAALLVPGRLWTDLRVVPVTGSTNADVAAAARSGTPEGLVVVAERQTAGRGRLDRRWFAPPRAGLTFSVLLRPEPDLPTHRFGWLPLLGGVALAEAVQRVALVDATLKWPNDVLVPLSAADQAVRGKCAGLLAEAVPGADAVVLGIGVNVTQTAAELPAPPDREAMSATSLALAGATGIDREALLIAILERLADWYGRWRRAQGDPDMSGLRAAYRRMCLTLGREVTVSLPNDDRVHGTASDVDADGRIVVRADDGEYALTAGDVRHVR